MQVGNGSVNGVGEDSICILHCRDSWRPLIILCEHYVHSSVCLLMKTVWVGFIHKCTGVKKWAAGLHDYPPPPYGKRTHTKLIQHQHRIMTDRQLDFRCIYFLCKSMQLIPGPLQWAPDPGTGYPPAPPLSLLDATAQVAVVWIWQWSWSTVESIFKADVWIVMYF